MTCSREEEVIAAERMLLDPAIRSNRAELERRLDPEFTEIGQSGRFWTREAALADLLSTEQSDYRQAEFFEPRVSQLAEGCFLLTYVVQVGARRSRRSSIWRTDGDQLRTVFNQGTPVPSEGKDFE